MLTALLLMSTLADANFIPAESDVVVVPETRLTVLRPRHDEQDVPLNARIWLDEETATQFSTQATPHEPRLFGPDGQPLTLIGPVKVSGFSGFSGILHVYTPAAPLAANARHELRTCDADECPILLAAFTTGSTADDDPSLVPTVLRLAVDLDDALVLEAEYSDPDHDILIVGDPNGSDDEPLDQLSLFTAFSGPAEFALGRDDLLGRTALRFAAYDLAGNFSGWTDPVEVDGLDEGCNPSDRGDREPFSCRAAAPSPWLLAIPLLLRRRRR